MGRMFGFRRVTRNFFRAGECSWNQGTSINIHLQHEIKRPRMEKISGFFRLETLENCILNENFYPQMTTIRAFFPQIRALFSNFRKRARETSPPLLPLLFTRLGLLGLYVVFKGTVSSFLVDFKKLPEVYLQLSRCQLLLTTWDIFVLAMFFLFP